MWLMSAIAASIWGTWNFSKLHGMWLKLIVKPIRYLVATSQLGQYRKWSSCIPIVQIYDDWRLHHWPVPWTIWPCDQCGLTKEPKRLSSMWEKQRGDKETEREGEWTKPSARIIVYYSLYPLSPRLLNAEFCFRLSLMLISKPNIGSQLTCKKVGLFIFLTFLLCFASHLDPALALSKNFFWHSLMGSTQPYWTQSKIIILERSMARHAQMGSASNANEAFHD